MAWTGDAQVEFDGAVQIFIKVIKGDVVRATVTESVDTSHLGAQIKFDTCENDFTDCPPDEQQSIPLDMKQSPQKCQLFLKTPNVRIPIDNFERLSKCREYFDGTEIVLEIYDQNATVEATSTTTLLELNIQTH